MAAADLDGAARPRRFHRFSLFAAATLLLLAAAMIGSLAIGTVAIPASEVWSILIHGIWPAEQSVSTAGRQAIVWELRAPRTLVAAVVGAGLGLVGAAMQSATRNPLSDPHLLGVSAGAAFGANLAILHVGDVLGPATTPLFAFAGALAATLCVLSVARMAGAGTADRLVLTGVAVAFVVMACANMQILFADQRAAASVVFWTLGGLGASDWSTIAFPTGALLIGGGWFVLKARDLNALAMGDETAATLGLSVERSRLVLLSVGAFVTGVMVAVSGMIGFVGLMTPHIARLILGGDNRLVLPASALLGSLFLVVADIVARTVIAPDEMPIGIVTGIVGGTFFVALLSRAK
ncbi:iron complex transport system permease protein [Methylopila capsulata]|uniref:ABC transporter permease n=1 Tax=Methylopila capsulata TaxID=61654 RepID=A0A9W6MQD2_9HYPH|nr:iron ABC transporter permease [Methylopila capsulata]MBM7851029.1 iron complex transport system permease protein [Methylopila capsulata]GLK54087.1 ABC transporter permease [Methylopila capsulata]